VRRRWSNSSAAAATLVVGGLGLAAFEPYISAHTPYSGEVFAAAGGLAILGAIIGLVALRRTEAGAPDRKLARIAVAIGGLAGGAVLIVFVALFVFLWLAYR
jgi:drug/metabolite transporter superfamily protein YnfA